MTDRAGDDRDGHRARLRRVEGQVRGIARMMDEERPCGEVLLQLRAAINALCRLQDHLLRDHLRDCVRGGIAAAGPDDRERAVDEIFDLVCRYRTP